MEFFRFELRYWLRGFMVYIFLGVLTLLYGIVAGTDFIVIENSGGNTFRNAPYAVMIYYAGAFLITALMSAAIYDSVASRDYSSKFSDILFSKPISKWHYLLGRFSAATVISIIPYLGVSAGILIAGAMPNIDAERWIATRWDAHLWAILFFALPNSLLVGAVVFAIAAWTRNSMYSFLGVVFLLIGYIVSQQILNDISYEKLAMLLDPFGISTYAVTTKYWTVDQRNSWCIPWDSFLLWNRLIWLGVSALIFVVASWRFSFSTGNTRVDRKLTAKDDAKTTMQPAMANWPKSTPNPSWLSQWMSSVWFDTLSIMRTPVFIVIAIGAMALAAIILLTNATQGYGLTTFPVTYNMTELVRVSFAIFLIAIITYFTGVVTWRDKDCRIQEIIGATPVPNSVLVASRFVSLFLVVLTILLIGIGMGCFVQAINGYFRFQPQVYALEVILIDGLRFGFMIVLAMLAHTFSPNKYIGYFAFVILLVVNIFAWQWLRMETLLVRFGRMPTYVYSDMFGIAPYWQSMAAFAMYWLAGSAIVLWVCSMAMHRGVPKSLMTRVREGFQSTTRGSRAMVSVSGMAMLLIGGWLYYDTQIVNEVVGPKERELRQVKYEETYEKFQKIAQPKVTKVAYSIDIYPSQRNVRMAAKQTIQNKSESPIETLYVNVAPNFKTTLEIPNATLELDDKRLNIRVYKLSPPLAPGESAEMDFVVESQTRGIENQVRNTELVQNGTFFNQTIGPSFGYDPNRRIMDPNTRKNYKLPPAEVVPQLTRECGDACQFNYVSHDSDWMEVETVISTSADQIAVAPGSLQEQWTKEGRNYYRYKLDHRSLGFYSFISARYEVERTKAGDIDVEVYYHPEHKWNVPRMSDSIVASLDYCCKEFGPYRHKQARIIEFPRVASFAQAFPGTMPYSESIGFIAKLDKPDDIDMVYYVVAHEMAHQWWAHQVIGARMQGATLLSETLAQYTALMIMRKEYGPDMMHKFLRYEMDKYLRARGTERQKERPLLTVDPDQGYIHYNKASVALYYLAEMIGEQRINAALKDLLNVYAYQGPPYPNAHALVDRLRAQTPEELQYLIKDLFEDITIFANRTLSAKATKQSDGRYLVEIEVECTKFKSDEKGSETECEMNDWMEIGAFAKPESGKRYGELLHRERTQLTSGKHSLKFMVDKEPYQAGIDPSNLMIDRIPDDNLKRVTIQ
jgi:ABC-2 type transport system permease protein